jgi:hypothetical protein
MTVDDRLLANDYLSGLEARPIEEIRAMRAECVAVETGLSFLRRMVQGPLDIVERELVRREVGGHADRATLIDELPGILADGPRPAGLGRLSQQLEPTSVDPELEAELEEILAGGVIADVTSLADGDLVALRSRLEVFFERIDALGEELTRRYRTGEATVDGLLD